MKPIKSLYSSYNQNDIYMLERIGPYSIINDNHQGLIVLDSSWNEVKRIKVDENLFVPEASYVDYINNRMLFKLEAFLCLVDIESSGVKLIELPDDLQDIYFSDLHCFCKDHIVIDTSKNVVSLDLIDFKITVLELASVDEYPFNEYQNRYNGIVMYFRKNKLICHDSGNIIIVDGTSVIEIPDVVSIKYYQLIASNTYLLAIGEKQLQLINLENASESKIISFASPCYCVGADIFEKQNTIHISLLLHNDWEEVMRVEEYAFAFDELHEHVVL
ncbi:hypothetical protein [Veillonella sp.]|uniref:hypothetical protein n=1 Tax=Veillonella sp. TaxID=1926307 RepID=UPI002908F652|nr:hypothetical protein [Veillonella sp.]MDU5494739.1 hypothetical protein [Veillonella sp.]